MKKTTIVLILLIVSSSLFAQVGKIKKAEKLYDGYSFSESINKYEQITEKTDEIKRHLAESYYNIGDYENSEKYYSELVTSTEKQADDVFNYASVLSINEKYVESEKQMKNYYQMSANDSRAAMRMKNPGFYNTLKKDKGQFVIKNLDMNTEQQDFGTAFYKNNLVYASTREKIKPIKTTWNWNNMSFLDMYIAETDSALEFNNIKNFYNRVNKKYHEGPISFNETYDFMAYTRNNYDHKSSDDIVKLQLFTSELIDDKWQKVVPMHFNSKEYSVGHAALTPDGKTMYFASDMPGGIGGVDIYKINRKEDGSWTDPQNMGNEINTEGDEMFPFYHPNGMLFFASDGFPGLGGLDVFVCDISNPRKFSNVENLAAPINSSHDDFALILDIDQKSGYFSSNRPSGKGDDDIYMFKLLKPIILNKIIKGTAFDKKGNILSNVEVNLFDNKGNVTGTITTTEDGKYEFPIDIYVVYSLGGTKEKYTKGDNTADATGEERVIIADLILERFPEFSLYCLITDEETKNPLDSVNIVFTNTVTNEEELIITTSSGDFLRQLMGKKLNERIAYKLKLERAGYVTETFTYSQILDHEGQYDMYEDMKKISVGMDLSSLIDINPIFFDLGKSNIRDDAAIELNKIVKVMNEYPTMEVELGSHTDCRASAAFNRRLSDKRAKSSAAYIKEKITKPERIKGKGYGESKLVNKCECEGSKKVPCTEDEHQENRRTEFLIIKME